MDVFSGLHKAEDGKIFFHNFDLSDDSVKVYDELGELKLIYTHDCRAVLPDGKLIGRLRSIGDIWVFTFEATGEQVNGVNTRGAESCLESEVIFSKRIFPTLV